MRYDEAIRKLAQMDHGRPRLLRFDPDAQSLYEEWSQDLEERIRAENERGRTAFANHLSKYRSLMPSLACIFEMAENVDAERLSLESAARAADFCRYLESHARRSYNARSESSFSAARKLSGRLKADAIGKNGTFTIRDVYKSGWGGLSTPGAARAACGVLEEYGWIRRIENGTGKRGRPSERFEVNPEVHEQ